MHGQQNIKVLLKEWNVVVSLDGVGPVVDSIERHNENFVSTDGERIF
jgi:hypothetical protein